jgi:parallel beta-helix repeat protein
MAKLIPTAGLVVRSSTTFEQGVYELGGRDGIVIDGDDIVVDGGGAVLRGASPPPPLPAQGDFLYSPGDLGLSREEHVLAVRGFPVPDGELAFVYRGWGQAAGSGTVSTSADRKTWTAAPRVSDEAEGGGWRRSRHDLGAWRSGPFHLRFTVPAAVVSPASPLFYDTFRLLQGDREIWRGDAKDNWQRWYNTGFSIWKRGSKRYYGGVAIRSTGRSRVRLVNFHVEGFMSALHLRDCSGWTIESNDFSDNYDDPDYGWGDGSECYGAVYLDGVTESTLRGNKGTRVWNGISMHRSSRNTIEKNDFSYCSNTCLKMTQSSDNVVADNALSWGIRIYPEEVHARDSVSLLVESGSDRNRFLSNDFSHGGDGIFIRVLNGWCSTGNVFEGNECSHANNNAVEAWSPGNTYIGNKANWSSYGFWLGGSDDTVLLDNEVMHNGETNRNAPEPFGNAGVSVVHGSSSSFVMAGNRIEGNFGPGLSLAFREETPARGWLVVGNTIRGNRDDPRGYAGRGVHAELCDGVALLGNHIDGNDGVELFAGRSVRNLVLDRGEYRLVRGLRLETPRPATAGREARISVVDSGPEHEPFTEYLWDLGGGVYQKTREPELATSFADSGLVRVCVTARGRGVAGSASRTVCILPPGVPIAGSADASSWRLDAPQGSTLRVEREPSVTGRGALVAEVRGGLISTLATELPAAVDLSRGSGIAFFFRYACELFVHTGKRNRSVGLQLRARDGIAHERFAALSWEKAPSEERYDWILFRAPWADFRGPAPLDPAAVRSIEVLFGPDEAADCVFRLDALTLLEA